MPLTRRFGGLLGALVMLSAMLGPLALTTPVLAASATTNAPAELRSGPGWEYPVTATIPGGAGLTIDGPPEAEFYPVTVNGQTGWVHGAVLNIVKDVAGEAPPAVAQSTAPVAAYDTETHPTAATPETTTAPAEAAPSATTPVSDPGQAGAAPAATATVAPVTDASVSDAVTMTPAAGAETIAATPDVTPAATASPTPEQSNDAATPTATPVLTGEASVPNGGTLFYAPDASSGTVFWVPAGSTVWRLGEERNGFAKADYMAMVGWIAIDQLAAPAPVTTEVIPADAEWAEDVRTPRPGSGVAFTEVELKLRAGPSAAEAELLTIPAGARVVMTGVMENGFHRIDYQGNVGWVTSDYLNTPPNPGDEDPATSRGDNRTYTREEIERIIYAAADRYNQDPDDMLRVAQCESALDPYAVHPSGSYGLFQFIRSTWKSTPYGDQSMFNPKANANAAAWMWQQGRRSEWVCK